MEEKGDQLMAEGEKVLKKFSIFGSNDDKVDKAHDKFLQAATQYKAVENFAKASQATKKAAEMSHKSKNDMDYMMELEEAGRLAGKAGDVPGAVSLMKEAVDLYDKKQKYQNAAKVCIELGEMTEGNEAMKWLEQAVKYYKAQGSKVTAQEVVNKMADVKARSGDYQGAMDMYDKLGREALDDPLARANARKLFFSSLLAEFASMTPQSIMEEVAVVEERFNEYQELDVQFNVHTREHMLITAMIDAVMNEDVDGMEEAISEYDSIVPLDATRQKMAVKAKAALRGRVNDMK